MMGKKQDRTYVKRWPGSVIVHGEGGGEERAALVTGIVNFVHMTH
jgi:hypothetical protein